jgi:Leucine-rich repeat (LRR) protein
LLCRALELERGVCLGRAPHCRSLFTVRMNVKLVEWPRMSRIVATSMRQALLAPPKQVQVLDLSRSEDLICNNLMCEKLGDPCVCKLARFLEQHDWHALEELRLAGNGLSSAPPAFFRPSLRVLDLSHNRLSTIPQEIERCHNLISLILNDNALQVLPWDSLRKLKRLEFVQVTKNPALNVPSHHSLPLRFS